MGRCARRAKIASAYKRYLVLAIRGLQADDLAQRREGRNLETADNRRCTQRVVLQEPIRVSRRNTCVYLRPSAVSLFAPLRKALFPVRPPSERLRRFAPFRCNPPVFYRAKSLNRHLPMLY